MQKLTFNGEVQIPNDLVLITKVEYEELKKHELLGLFWRMEDLENRVGHKRDWIKEHILLPIRFRRQLDIDFGGFVYYPEIKGEVWSFHARKMAIFLDKNHHLIFKEKGGNK